MNTSRVISPIIQLGDMVFTMTESGLVSINVSPQLIFPNYTVLCCSGYYYRLDFGQLAPMQSYEVAAFLAHTGSPFYINGLYYYLPNLWQQNNESSVQLQRELPEPVESVVCDNSYREEYSISTDSQCCEDVLTIVAADSESSNELEGKVCETSLDSVTVDSRLSYASALKTNDTKVQSQPKREQAVAKHQCIYCSRSYNVVSGCECIMARLHWSSPNGSVSSLPVKKEARAVTCSNCLESGHYCNTGMCCNRCHLPGHVISECNSCAEPEHSNEPCIDWHLCPIVLAKTTCKICNNLGHFANTCNACRYCKGNCEGPVCAVYKAKQESRKIFQEKTRVLMNPQVSDVAHVVIKKTKKGKKSQSERKSSPEG